MAQTENAQTTFNAQNGQRVQNGLHLKSTSKAQASPTFQQLLQREGSKWSHISADKLKKNYEKEDEKSHHNKKSLLAKVKEKAKKLKHSLSTKKHRDENDPRCNSISSAGADNKGKQDLQYQRARMSEAKHIPDTKKPATRDHHGEALKSIPENHSATSNDEPASSSNTITETRSKNLSQSDGSSSATADVPKAHDLPESGSRFSGLRVSTSREGDGINKEGENMKGESQMKDKAVSVKEYLMQKLEPGEDERALSQIIIQTISPRRDKVREAVSLFLKNEEPSESKSKHSKTQVNSPDVSNDKNTDLKSKSLPASVNRESKIASIDASHSLRSNASLDLNQTFKSSVASYQNHNTNPGSNHLHSPTRSSSSPLGHGSSEAPALTRTDANKVHASNGDQTRVPSHIGTNVTRVPVSSARSQVPSNYEINTIRLPLSTTTSKAIQVPGQTISNATRFPSR